MRHCSTAPALALAATLLAALPAAAFEATGDPVADALLSILEAQGGEVTVGGASTSDGVTAIEGFQAVTTEDGGTSTLRIATITVDNGAVTDGGGLTADAMGFQDLSVTSMPDEGSITVAEIAASDVRLPPPAVVSEEGLASEEAHYGELTLSSISLVTEDGVPVPIERIALSGSDPSASGPRTGSFSLVGLALPPEALDDEDLAAQLAGLGYSGITLNVEGEGSWQAEDGRLDLSRVALEAVDMGVLTLTGDLSGLTEEVLDKLGTEDQDPNEALAVLNEVLVSAITVEYRDEGLAERVIAQTAAAQGATPAEFATQMGQAMPMMLSAIEDQAFIREVTEAVTSFLGNPGTLTVSADPQQPLPVSQIVGTAMMAPQTIPTVLGVTVRANR